MSSPYFYIDTSVNSRVSFEQLANIISNQESLSNVCQCDNYLDIFTQLICSLIADVPVVLVDSDISANERLQLLEGIDQHTYDVKSSCSDITPHNLLDKICAPKNHWTLTLFTSGTTGLPKRVSHTFETLTRNIKRGQNTTTNIWGYAYNPTHMAGLQVFFQALLNRNTIVRLFGLSKQNILNAIETNQITHISATPTFYRLLLPLEKQYPSVVKITSGGEKFDSLTLSKLTLAFPNAKITNVYASTEAGSLLAAKGDVFEIKKEHNQLFNIIEGELLIHKSLLGNSNSIQLDGEWYHTHDMVEVVNHNPTQFKFVSRKNEMINVGGYKVNPSEVEEFIRQIDNIKEVLVYGKENKLLGNIICCDIVPATNQTIPESDIRLFLSSKLQEFKIPRIIRFVESIQTTKTGKLSRK